MFLPFVCTSPGDAAEEFGACFLSASASWQESQGINGWAEVTRGTSYRRSPSLRRSQRSRSPQLLRSWWRLTRSVFCKLKLLKKPKKSTDEKLGTSQSFRKRTVFQVSFFEVWTEFCMPHFWKRGIVNFLLFNSVDFVHPFLLTF